ncbi:Zn-dependent alcohol dehydrogenase [Candidatus Nitrososphaera evergladensis SR1]|uniref:Zn-dependent alcohol dehydrogenase n=1 Tax=Candidatus Nitrososphaera evergladensis SR1 TaxID=1459636 RepID=A0A075N1A4_9ARCH|nr:zinc-binding dehydrogenase [Candidatus Nitrososphaera evergladensis]AIF85244.1 Zn-dependent alcohol dehydrogenase [Candidatus Nitrososphaera evergladensis SR1]
MMKAVPFYQHGPVDMLRYEDFPEPEPAKGQVVIDVEYCGVNHLDIWTRMGITGKKIRLPHICGCDIVGAVKKSAAGFDAGERVMVYPGASCGKCTHCKAGRENLCSQFAIIGGTSDYNGGYAAQVAVPARNVVRLGKMKIDLKTAATLAVSYLTAWNMLSANSAKKGKSLLVYGAASGVGMATIQLARAMGVSTIITTAAGPEKAKFGKKLGAHHVIDRSETKDIAGEVFARLGGKGVDIVIDHVGAATWQTSIASLMPGGRMAVCGMTSGNDATVPVRMFYSKQVAMTGALLGTKAQLVELLRLVQAKKIKPVIDSVFPLKEAGQAQDRMEKGLHAGKILLNCRR